MKHKGKISGLLLGNTVAVTEWIAMQDVISKLDARSFLTVLLIYIIQMVLSYYFGYRYDKRMHGDNELQGMKGNEFIVDFFEKVAALSERDTHNTTTYILSIKEWNELKETIQEKKLNQLIQKMEYAIVKTIRKSDVVTRWDENKYVIVAVDHGYEKSTITDRLEKSIRNELVNDVVNITLLFGAASYPVEGKSLEELLKKAQDRLYKNRDLKDR
ncbi:diguanylate cyclase [Bacillus clarus]|uniref:Diguanylate cyclase n=1 Tax=Bacillus clarus TaxID=2338372 RepID=A0A090YW77_9BACI|nr:diguanylate cyclase [Bacillus clarus]KFN03099.1 diguanylate cyclase domain protein [Bacillus clarus]RFT68793.1 diguanylate cyclase [Bacillus clarus]